MKRHSKRPTLLHDAGNLSIDDVARLMEEHSAVDLAMGSPSGSPPDAVRQAGVEAMHGGFDQYGDIRGIQPLREAIADYLRDRKGIAVNPDTEITVTSGAAEALTASLSSVISPGDEVITFEPFYEPYAPLVRMLRARLRTVRLYGPEWSLDERGLAGAFTNRTKAIIFNDPHNPTGKVFTAEELLVIARYCERFGVVCIADEVYEHFTYDGRRHVSIAELDGMRERTVLIGSLSKTYQASGWRIGFAAAPEHFSTLIRERHELFSGGAPTPLQVGAIRAFQMPDAFYLELRREYQRRRDYLGSTLSSLGFSHSVPAGSFYIFTDVSRLGEVDSEEFALRMMRQAGVACVPGRCFYSEPAFGRSLVRFCFAKEPATLEITSRTLSQWLGRGPSQQAMTNPNAQVN